MRFLPKLIEFKGESDGSLSEYGADSSEKSHGMKMMIIVAR